MKTVVLRTHKRTKSDSFSDALFRTLAAICWSVNNENDKTDNCPVIINYVIVLQILNFSFYWQADKKKYYKENNC
jgi:hypothetical protein